LFISSSKFSKVDGFGSQEKFKDLEMAIADVKILYEAEK